MSTSKRGSRAGAPGLMSKGSRSDVQGGPVTQRPIQTHMISPASAQQKAVLSAGSQSGSEAVGALETRELRDQSSPQTRDPAATLNTACETGSKLACEL